MAARKILRKLISIKNIYLLYIRSTTLVRWEIFGEVGVSMWWHWMLFLKCMNNKHATTIFGCLLSFCTFEILAFFHDSHLGCVMSNINELVAEILDLDHLYLYDFCCIFSWSFWIIKVVGSNIRFATPFIHMNDKHYSKTKINILLTINIWIVIN